MAGVESKGAFYSKQVEKIEQESKYYQKHAEQHEKYNIEWKSFWERRYKELEREGKDPDRYDYRPEWCMYWTEYANKYYEEKLASLKTQLEKELAHAKSPISQSSPSSSLSLKRATIVISDSSLSSSDESYRSLKHSRQKKPKYTERKRRSVTPLRRISFSPISSETDSKPSPIKVITNEPINLVTVLRILSALDGELGLLGSRVIELLAKSLELEKASPNSSEMLVSGDNVIFLETIKEKLKGLILTNLLSEKKTIAAKKCIQNIAQLIHQCANSSKCYVKSPPCATLNPIDAEKMKVAEMIAQELTAQGKTDYTTEELEVIIEVYLDERCKGGKSMAEKNPKTQLIYEKLNDEDLSMLIGNFTKLSEHEQLHLIKFITEIENTDPERVKHLELALNKQPQLDENSNTVIINDDDSDDYNVGDLISQIKQA